MSEAEPAWAAAGYCADLVRSADFERYAATLLVSAEQRHALLALYAFDLEIARVRDHITQPLAGEIRLQWWSDTLVMPADAGEQGSPVAAELLRAIHLHHLPADLFVRVIDGHRFDLYDDPIQTIGDLQDYLSDTAAPLFDLAARIAGENSPDTELVRHAALAFGLARTIESLGRNASRRQLFLPMDLIDRFGVDVEDIFSGAATAELGLLLRDLCGDARQHLEAALAALPQQASRRSFLPLALIGRRLNRIEQPAYDPFKPPAPPSNLATLWQLWRASRRPPFRG